MVQDKFHPYGVRDSTFQEQVHTHAHPHRHTNEVLARMQQMLVSLKSIRDMVEEGCDCSEVLIELSKAENEIKGIGRTILKDHMEHCIVEAVKDGDDEPLERLNQALDHFMR